MNKEARQAFIFSYLRIQKAEDEHDQMRFALDWFKAYGEETYKSIKNKSEETE